MDNKKWLGRTILSQYGLICEVTKVDGDLLTCLDDSRDKFWNWTSDTVSLITHNKEILDPENGEVYGKINEQGDWELYPETQVRIISPEEVEREFNDN